jgi:hypothetical protein
MALGRSTESRTVASVGTTSASAAITAPAGSFASGDAGRSITGTGIPAGATISAVTSDTAATLSANAIATGTITATIGSNTTPHQSGQTYGFVGWSPETDLEAKTYSLAAVNAGQVPPSKITNTYTAVTQRGRG